MPITLSPQELGSFDGPHRTVTVKGPLTLFRLCGKNASGKAGEAYGRFWFNERFFWNTVDVISSSAANTAEMNHYLRFILREFTAVCFDWNAFASIYRLQLPAGETLELVMGRIAPQPFFSASDPKQRKALPHELLVGGEFQYIIDISGTPKLKNFIQGPRPLLLHQGGRA